jgi:hypothetical protein
VPQKGYLLSRIVHKWEGKISGWKEYRNKLLEQISAPPTYVNITEQNSATPTYVNITEQNSATPTYVDITEQNSATPTYVNITDRLRFPTAGTMTVFFILSCSNNFYTNELF